MKNVLMSWRGGKYICLALYEIQEKQGYRVEALLTGFVIYCRSDRVRFCLQPDLRQAQSE